MKLLDLFNSNIIHILYVVHGGFAQIYLQNMPGQRQQLATIIKHQLQARVTDFPKIKVIKVPLTNKQQINVLPWISVKEKAI